MEGIRLVEALERMETAQEPFTLRFVTRDRTRKTGGKVVEWANCQLAARQRTGRGPATGPEAPSAERPHRHYANGTRNLVVGKSSQRRKVHIWLLLALNGEKIVL